MITYCVVYCTFYVRKLISSSVDEENVVKRIIIKNDWIIFLFEREYLEIFSSKEKRKNKNLKLINSIVNFISQAIYYNYNYNYSYS